jgi:hypothetical protein
MKGVRLPPLAKTCHRALMLRIAGQATLFVSKHTAYVRRRETAPIGMQSQHRVEPIGRYSYCLAPHQECMMPAGKGAEVLQVVERGTKATAATLMVPIVSGRQLSRHAAQPVVDATMRVYAGPWGLSS